MHAWWFSRWWFALLSAPIAGCLVHVEDLRQPLTDEGDASQEDVALPEAEPLDGGFPDREEDVALPEAAPETAIPQDYASVVLADDPLGYWRLDDAPGSTVAKEETGSGVTATFGVADFGVTGALAEDNKAIGLSGGSALSMSDAFDFEGRQPFSLEGWFRPSKVDTTYRHFFAKELHVIEEQRQYGYSVSFNQTILTFEREPESPEDGPITSAPVTTRYQHIVATYDGSDMCLYVDEVATCNPSTTSLINHTQPFKVGLDYEGWVDEIAVYAIALPPDRIAAHHQAAMP